MKKLKKRAFELTAIELQEIFKLHDERTKYILSHPKLIAEVNASKRSKYSLVAPNGIKKPICEDGILKRGACEYIGGYWTRKSNGHETKDYINSSIRILVATKDSNEGVEENEDTTNLGVEWDIKNETLRSNKSEEICIKATFAKTYMRLVSLLLLFGSHSENEILDVLKDIDRCRNVWEDAPLARINLKKQPGNGYIRDTLLSSYISLYKDVLIRQVQLINPTVIINSAGTPGMNFFKMKYQCLECADEHYDKGQDKWIFIDKATQVIIINSFHFSYGRWNSKDLFYYKELLHRLLYVSRNIENLLK